MFKQKEANLPSGMKQSTVALKDQAYAAYAVFSILANTGPVAPLKSHKLSLEYATFWQPAETSCMLKWGCQKGETVRVSPFSAKNLALSSPQENAFVPSGLIVTPRTKPCMKRNVADWRGTSPILFKRGSVQAKDTWGEYIQNVCLDKRNGAGAFSVLREKTL